MTHQQNSPKTSIQAAEVPQGRTVVTRNPDGSYQSTVTVNVQVTTTLGPSHPLAVTSRAQDEEDTNDGPGSKGNRLEGKE